MLSNSRWQGSIKAINKVIIVNTIDRIEPIEKNNIAQKSESVKSYVLEIRDKSNPDGSPIAWLFVEREEEYRCDERDGSVNEAAIKLRYRRLEPKRYNQELKYRSFLGGYRRGFNGHPAVSITSQLLSRGAVFLDLPGLEGQRIGTYLMNEIVLWAMQWPEAEVCKVELFEGQADNINKDRRNRFWEQFGLQFNYRDLEKREGISKAMKAGSLTPVETWKENIRVLNVQDFINDIISENEKLNIELTNRNRAYMGLSEWNNNIEKYPIRWGLRRMWWRYQERLINLSFLILIILAFWTAIA